MKQANMDWVMKAQEAVDSPQRVTPAATYGGRLFLSLPFPLYASPFVLAAFFPLSHEKLPAGSRRYGIPKRLN